MAISKHMNQQHAAIRNEGRFVTTGDGCKLFIYDYLPAEQYKATIYIIAGITGINHHNERGIIELLSINENRIVIVHPRGTGYSDGVRGDISDMSLFISDYREIIKKDNDYISKQDPIFLFGHSMSCAVLLAVADELTNIDGAILINPPYMQKKAKGMSPSFGQYIKYAFYMLFARHKPIVNMTGDPSQIENEEDRKECEQRLNDPLLVKYFSMFYMSGVKKMLSSMLGYSEQADYPLLLIYGMKDSIVDKAGCDLIYSHWKNTDKTYETIEDGTHGKSSVIKAKGIIAGWIHCKVGECNTEKKTVK